MTIDEFGSPGELIQNLLESRGWSQRTLSVILEIGEATITRLLSGRQPVGAELAVALEDVFDVPAGEFLSLQSKLDLANARKLVRPDPARARRVRLHGDLPIGEMMKRGWLPAKDVRDATSVEAALVRFFGVDRVEEIDILRDAPKPAGPCITPAQRAWLRRVKQIASGMAAAPYSPQAVHAGIARLRASLGSLDAVAEVPRILTGCGIRFVIVETLAAAKVDGACLWLNDRTPVIGMSIRIDRIDNFWSVLRRQLERVVQGQGRLLPALDAELEGDRAGSESGVVDENHAAADAALDFCIPSALLDDFIAQNVPFVAERDLIGFARLHRIHPGILAGQIQCKTGSYSGRYNRFRAHLAKVRAIVSRTAVTDGWGVAAAIETGRRRTGKSAAPHEAILLH